jgi:VanZ family protein
MFLIYYFSSRQTAGIITQPGYRFLFFKTLHLLEYAILAIFLYWPISSFPVVLITAFGYALTDEFHQLLVPGRQGALRDVFIDLIGITLGLFFIQSYRSLRSQISPKR